MITRPCRPQPDLRVFMVFQDLLVNGVTHSYMSFSDVFGSKGGLFFVIQCITPQRPRLSSSFSSPNVFTFDRQNRFSQDYGWPRSLDHETGQIRCIQTYAAGSAPQPAVRPPSEHESALQPESDS